MSSRFIPLLLAAGALAGAAAVGPAQARGGTSFDGDSYINDAVKNPRFIEPYADRDPSRYRAYYPRAGYADRVRAARGYGQPYGYEYDGYAYPAYRGRITVRPYPY